MKRVLPFVLLLACSAPALGQTVDSQGAKQLTDDLARYFSKKPFDIGFLKVSVEGDAYKLAFDFTAAFAEENVAAAAASLRIPTLLLSGGLSPYVTQRIVQRLGEIIECAEIRHLPAAGHMLPLTHASSVNTAIARHISRADELANVPLAVEAAVGLAHRSD